MKKYLVLLFVSVLAMAGENGPADWEYWAPGYSVNIPGDDPTQAVLVGAEFPSGLRVLRDYRTEQEFKAVLSRIVDALSDTASKPKKAKHLRRP